MRGQVIKIAQVSDSHLLDDAEKNIHGINPYRRLQKIFQWLFKKSYDLILFTGDITNNASEKSFQQLSEILKPHTQRVLAISGNHDNSNFLARMASDFLIVEPGYPLVIGEWRFIYVNTVVLGKNYGFITDYTIDRLRQQLEECKHNKICI